MVPFPGGAAGIGFDDLRYSPSLGSVLAPGGRTGSLFLVDPASLAVDRIDGFSTSADVGGGHDFGATSVDEGAGLLFVTDRTTETVHVVDPKTKKILSSRKLAAHPDYVRYVGATRELWITEPGASQLEVLSLAQSTPFEPKHAASIPIENGPESIVVDELRGRVYVHRWQAKTVSVDVRTRTIAEEWLNGCAASRGIVIDQARGWLLVGCLEGTLAVLDVANHGRLLGSIARGSGFDVIGWDPVLRHVYMVGFTCRCLVVHGLSMTGAPSFLGRFDALGDGSCAVSDEHGHAFVCGPDGGKLHRYDDPFPALP